MGNPTHSFLFTDIESSTRLWEEHPGEMPDALARHDEILRRAATALDGRVLKTTGDGMIAVFTTTRAAVDAALAAQLGLASETWERTGPIRVRMGIHTGEAESRDQDFFGPTMNRAARIMSAGHGGQVLVSAAAADQVRAALPDGAGLLDLGNHRLKDLTDPEHLYQLTIDGLTSDFPAPRTLDARPHNLPIQTTEFLGRQDELATIGAMLESPTIRLLTIAGPGGAGKTRLAIQVAAEHMDRYPDGVFFVDLSAERDPSAAFEAVVRALDLPVSGAGDSLEVLRSRLRDRKMLLVLDNLEQVTSMGPGLGELLQSAPALNVVTTTRETLHIRAEHVYPIPPLDLPHPDDPLESIAEAESVQLFVERARAVRPDFSLTEDTAAAVAEICLRLDGLPLAIELAAARLRVFTPTDLLERLRERLDILGAGGRDLPDRQRTLWGAIGWSYELLDEDERRLLDMTSVFSTARIASLESVAAESLGLDPIEVLDLVTSLVEKSLIRVHSDGSSQRFSMLLMIKEYTAERLAGSPDTERAVRLAHARHYSAYVERLEDQLHGAERQTAIDDLEAEIGNLRTAWRYWVDHEDLEQLFALLDGLWVLHEAKGWYHAAIELANDTLHVLALSDARSDMADRELTLRTSLARAVMAVQGYGPEVERSFRAVLELAEQSGSARRRFPVLRALATYYIGTVRFDNAAELGAQMLELAEIEDDQAIMADALYVLGASTAFLGDVEKGLDYLERAIELTDTAKLDTSRFRLGPSTAVVSRAASGLILWQCGALDRGRERVIEALAVARRIGHPFSIAYALWHNGLLALYRGRFTDAEALAKELGAVAEENEYQIWSTLATVLEGVALTGQGETGLGAELTETGVTLYRGLTTPPVFWPGILSLRSQVQAMTGNLERALALGEEAFALGENLYPEFGVTLGEIVEMLPQPDLERAEELYRSAIRAAREGEAGLAELKASTHLVSLLRRLGRTPDGSEELAEIYSSFTEGFDEQPLVAARAVLETSPG